MFYLILDFKLRHDDNITDRANIDSKYKEITLLLPWKGLMLWQANICNAFSER